MLVRLALAAAAALVLLAAPAAAHRVFFVDPTVAQSGNGMDWSTAFKTIQEGIDASDGDDTVIIAPGVYAGPITVRLGAQLYGGLRPGQYDVFKRQPLIHRVVIDARGTGRGLTMDVGCELNGLWILNGNANGDGGGLLVDGNATFVSGCIFVNCRASGSGQALHVKNSVNAVIENCVIAYSGAGAAVTVAGGSPEFVNNVFFRNDDGVSFTGTGAPALANNSFYRNGGRAADFPAAGASPSIENNHFDGNGALVRVLQNDIASVAALNALPSAQHNLGGDPRYIDANTLDFALEPNSPLIDTGKDRLIWSFLDIAVQIRPYDDKRVLGPSSPRDIGPHEWFGTKLAASGPRTPGSTIGLALAAPNAPNRGYVGACAFSPGPIAIDSRVIFLNADPLFFLTALGKLPTVFRAFAGALDAAGNAAPSIALPRDARLTGQRFLCAFLVLDPIERSGVKDITRTIEITIQ